jgi:hypothetical protein
MCSRIAEDGRKNFIQVSPLRISLTQTNTQTQGKKFFLGKILRNILGFLADEDQNFIHVFLKYTSSEHCKVESKDGTSVLASFYVTFF